jgi:hypothetical protein
MIAAREFHFSFNLSEGNSAGILAGKADRLAASKVT